MKTFTTCAEKKAKQILNLLQGYTKGIRMTAILILLLMGVGNAWGATVYLRYQANMPSDNYNASNSQLMTVSSIDGNRYYCELSLSANTSYGFFIKKDNNYYKVNTNASSSKSVELYDYGSSNYGNSNHRVTYKTGSSGKYIFTFDASNSKIVVSPQSETVELVYDKANGHDSWWDLDNKKAMTQDGSNYYCDVDLNKEKYYMFIRINNTIFWRGTSALPHALYYYGDSNFGNSGDKMNYTPTATSKHRFIWNHLDKTLSVKPFYTVTFDANGHGTAPGAQTILSGTKATEPTAPTASGYTFEGWYKEAGCTNKWNFSTDVVNDNITLYAKWTANQYSITYKDQGGGAFSGTHASGYPTKHTYGTTTTLKTATKDGYTFEGWFTNSGCTGSKVTSLGATAYTANITLYAKWTINNTYYLAVKAGDGISTVSGSADPVTLGSTYAITATPKTGYTFSTWTANPAANATFGSATTANTTVTVKNGSVTVTASATENLHAIIVQSSDDNHGTITQSADKAGIATSITITAEPEEGYRFVNWTTETDEITIADPNSAYTTVTATAEGTITANFEEIPLETIYFVNKDNWSNVTVHLWGGDADDTTWPGRSAIKADFQLNCCDVYYVSAESGSYNNCIFSNKGSNQTADLTWTAGKYFYNGAWRTLDYFKKTVTLSGDMNDWNPDELAMDANNTGSLTVSLDANQTYEFKIIVNDDWHGNTGTMTYGNSEGWTMSSSESSKCKITTAGAGDYTFTYDVCTAKLTVTYPTSYTITYSQTPIAAAGAPTTSPSVATGKYVAADTKVTFTAQAPNTGYIFKGWYDNIAGTGTALSSDLTYTCTINANTTVYAVYIENKYKVVAIANPAAYGTVTPETATTMSESNGGDITATPRNGYQLDNWTIKSGTGYFGETGTNTTSTTANTKFRPTADSEVQANFSAINYTITYHLDGGTNHTGNPTNYTIETPTITLKDPTKTGYTFNGWYSEAGFTNQVTQIATGSTGYKNLYAKWTENTVTISPTNAYDKGNPGYANPTASNSGKIGISSTSQLVAPSPGEGYTFAGWTLSDNIVVITGDASSNRTITVRHKTGDGSAVSAVANYNENLESTYYVRGGKKFANSWDVLLPMTKKSGEADQKIVYYTVNIDATNNGNTANSDFQFKIFDKTGEGTWWGLQTDNCNEHAYWYGRATTGEQTMTQCSNIDLRADAAGAYEIKVDYTDDKNPKITVNFPSASLSLVGSFNSWNESANPFIDNSDDNTATASITLNEGEYEFKIKEESFWRTNTGTVERYSNNTDIDFSQSSTNTNLIADIPGTYTFVYNKETHKLTVQYPTLTIRLAGEFNGWNKSDDNYKFTEDPAKPGTYTLAKEFVKRERWEACGKEQAEYEFKLNISGTDYTVEGNGNQKLLQYTRQNTTKVVNDGTSYNGPFYNLLLQADITGEYLFTYDHKTRKMTVTHPEYTPEASYIVGDFSDNKPGTDAMPCNPNNSDEGHDWTEKYGKPFENGTADCVEFEDGTWHFKIKINGIWYGADIDPITTSGVYTLDDEYADTGEKNVTLTTNGEEGCYYFEYTLNGDGTLSVLIIFPNDTRTVAFNMQGRGTQVDPQHVLYNQTAVKPYVSDVDGYLFAGWYTDAACTKEYDFNTPVTQDITLYAKWIPYENCIFYKNNLNWDSVYVYFYSSDLYWDNDKGTGAQYDKKFTRDEDTNHSPHYRKFRGKMTRIGLTDIWYFDYISAAKVIDSDHWEEIKARDRNTNDYSNIAFTAHKQDKHEYFDNTKVIRRGDFKPQMQLFIPQTDQTPTYLNKHDGVSAKYYNKGLWLKYNSTESGYNWSSDVGNWDNSKNYFTSEIAGGYSFTAEVELNAGSTYEFKIHNQNGTWYGNPGTMTQDNCTNWWFKEEVNDNAQIQPTVKGTYIFTAYLGDGKVMISLDYPLSTGDYRLAYLDTTANSFHPGHYLKKRSTSHLDTVSFFIRHNKQPQVIAQRCTDIDAQGNATWETITSILVNPATPITESGVYNFTLEQLADQTDPHLLNETRPYTGDYYIRTDAAAGGWKSFRQEGNKMTYSSYADEHEDFNHYFCEWVSQEKGLKNVSYTVANDYSYCISDTLDDDVDTNHPIIVSNNDLDKKGNLPVNNDGTLKDANVRFGWDSKINKLRRAYIAGSGHKKDRFLVLEGNEHLTDIDGNRYTGQTAPGQDRFNLTDDEVVLDDMGNWIYQMDVHANNLTKIKLTARYNELVQYFKGTETKSVALLESTAGTNYKIRLIYDFKTNHLVIAWLAGGEKIDGDEQELGADMMIIRRNQDPAEQLNFDPTTQRLSGVGTAYAVITFDKYFLNNKDKITGNALAQADEKSENERKFYWISFPFDVKLSDVFGFGEYGDQWIMQYYDGAARAQNGYWIDSPTFWKYITNKNYVLKAGQGYVLCLNLNKMGFTSTVFAHTTEVSLYFPSASPLNIITGELPTEVTVPAHECTIERDNRNIYDSNWNLIGVPGFADITDVSIGESHHKEHNTEIKADCVSFYYKYVPADNKYDATTNKETFQTMFAYMVQFAGTINWQAKTMPAQLAARRTGSTPSQYDLRLELAQGEQTDQTFVQLKEEDATAEFDMNVDMTKIFNSGMNIYTLTGSNAIQVAGNALPMAKATIPVGVVTATAGEYTFRMPDGTDGISVFLIDNQTGAQTNMLLDEYTVTLDAGTCENRFYLAVDPDRAATSVEDIGEEAKGQIKKFLIDGQLFIRTADGTFDAKGQRL